MNEFIIPLILSLAVAPILFGGFGLLMDTGYDYYQDNQANYQDFIAGSIEFIYTNYKYSPIVFIIIAFVGTYSYMSYRRGL